MADDEIMHSKKLSAVQSEIADMARNKEEAGRRALQQFCSAQEKVLQLATGLLEAERSVAETMASIRSSSRMLFEAIDGFKLVVAGPSEDQKTGQGADEVWIEGESFDEQRSEEAAAADEELAALRAQVASLTEGRVDSREVAAAEIAALTAEVMLIEAEKAAEEMEARERIDALEADLERLRAAKLEAERTSAEAIADLQAETESLVAETELLESSEAELPTDGPTDSAGVEDEDTSVDEVEPLPLEEPVIEPVSCSDGLISESRETLQPALEDVCRTAELPAVEDVRSSDGQPAEGDRPGFGESAAISGGEDETDPFAFLNDELATGIGGGGAGASSSGFGGGFAVDRSMKCIAIASPDDVVELYQSLNRARVAMEDHTTKTCDAFLSVIKDKDRPRVYIALYMVDSKETLVYVPERQPENEAECAKVLDEGMAFIEIVGFMMDRLDPGKDQSAMADMVGAIPVFGLEA
jgi:hypothetical protein